METSYSYYRVEKEDHIAWVYLDRPKKRNAMGPAAWTEIIPIFDEIDNDPDILVCIIAGEGKDFCAGIDIMGMADMIPTMKSWDMGAKATVELFKDIKPLQDSMSCVEKCRKPVICAIHGRCIGAGLDLASACDIRLATKDATISLRETAVAFVCDVGSLQRMPYIVGQGITREMAYTAEFMDAERAKEVNLVNKIYEDRDSLLKGAREMAFKIAANAPLAVQASKEVLNYCRGKGVADGLEYVAARSSMILPSEDISETIKAMMGKRQASFTGN
ncbi:MAG: crotonase/enoyl-CoA hydratase family protein [Thermodesulfobacteriota bacterium]|nr:crotonase/enoyl-CoA hydratase family protein [Thermodesulfobacteriota bacterium]